jgi:hypothetical protein
MKPKTKVQKEIISLKSELPKLTAEQRKEAKSMHTKFVLVQYKQHHYCLECSHHWKADGDATRKAEKSECPKCKTKLKLINSYQKEYEDKHYFGVLDTVNGWQVVRLFLSSKFLNKSNRAKYSLHEVVQHWIDSKGNQHTIYAKTMMHPTYYDMWVKGDDLEFRSKSSKSYYFTRLYPTKVSRKFKVLPVIKRNGFKTSTHDLLPNELMSKLITDSRTETLFKAKQYDLVHANFVEQGKVDKYWNTIKIVLRNNYKISSVKDWFDYLDLLEFFGKDLRNAKYVCPDNLKASHDKYVAKKAKHDATIEIEKNQKDFTKSNKTYIQQKKRFFDLMFKMDNLTVEPLKSVEEFLECSKVLKHCIFTNTYYTKKNTLVMVARLDGEIIENIELSLQDFRILQARGKFNKESKYNSKIRTLVQDNIHFIQQRALKQAS